MNKSSIIYLQYTNPAGYPPLEHSSRILADNGWKVSFVGCGASGEADRFEFPAHENIRVFRWRFPKPGWRQKSHFFFWTLWAIWITLRTRSKWIYTSEPLSCPAAWLASFLPGRRVLYHEHDSPPIHGISRFARGLLWFRKKVCDKAKAAILPNGERARIFEERVRPKCPVQVVWNCPEKREVIEVPRFPKDNYILFYHGSLNLARLPISTLDALAILPKYVVLYFAGYTTSGSKTFINDFLNEAQKKGIKERVQYLGSFSRKDLLPICAKADLGLAFMPVQSDDINMVAMTGASNKAFDYMACGLNLVVSDLPDWKKMFVDGGYAKACNPGDPKSIAEAVSWFLENPGEAISQQLQGKEKISKEWNYEHQFEPVLQLLSG